VSSFLRRHGPSLGLLLGLALVAFLPALGQLAAAPVGMTRAHPVDSCWLYAITSDALLSWPPGVVTSLFDHPDGWRFFGSEWGFADLGNAALAAPLVALLGPVLAYNLVQLALFWAAGVAAYALGWVLTRSRLAALGAGALFAWSDHLFFALQWGEDDVASAWVVPAFLAVLFWSLERRPRSALLAGAMLGLAGWFNQYYLFFNALLLGLVALWLLPLPPRRSLAEARRWARHGAALLGGLALVYGPRLMLGVREARWVEPGRTSGRVRGFGDLLQVAPDHDLGSSMDLSAALNPLSPLRHGASELGFLEGTAYLGLLALALALLGWLKGGLRRRWFVVAMGLTGFALALGSYLKVEGQLVSWGAAHPVPLPLGPLGLVVPFLGRMNHPYRFALLAFLALAVLGGAGAAWAVRRLLQRRASRLLLWALLLAACLLERGLASPGLASLAVQAPPVASGLERLPEVSGRPGVLHLPLALTFHRYDLEGSKPQRYAQLVGHGRPLVLAVDPAWLLEPTERAEMACHLAGLAERGTGLVVISEDLPQQARWFTHLPQAFAAFADPQVPLARANLEQLVQPSAVSGAQRVYTLPSAAQLLPGGTQGCPPASELSYEPLGAQHGLPLPYDMSAGPGPSGR